MTDLLSDIRKVPLTRIVVPYVFGLILGEFLVPAITFVAGTGLLLIILVLLLIRMNAQHRKHNGFYRICIWFIVVLTGIIYQEPPWKPGRPDLDGKVGYITGTILDVREEKTKTWMADINATGLLNDSFSTGLSEKIRVYISKDFPFEVIPGDTWTFYGRLSEISNAGNPGEFDYKSYMLQRNCRYQLFVSSVKYTKRQPDQRVQWKFFPLRLRQKILSKWDAGSKRDAGNEDVAVLSALTLGYRPLLSRETRASFADAGAMHLLAVSGLHVGMIWWILNTLIRIPSSVPSRLMAKNLLIICILWTYAGMTGFSNPVTRSVTMFSLISFSKIIQRPGNIYNTLLLSAFVLLLLKPSRILEPGFQLSYSAVFGIVSVQPVLARTYQKLPRYACRIFDLLSVSIAAQISTLPLILLYFHQFPVWFLLTNIIAIPLVSVILCVFTLTLPFLIMVDGPGFYSEILIWLARMLRIATDAISGLPHAVIHEIPMTQPMAILLAGAVFFMVLGLCYQRPNYLTAMLFFGSAFLLLSARQVNTYRNISSVEIFNFRTSTVISGYEKGYRHTYLLKEDTLTDSFFSDYLASLERQPYRAEHHVITSLTHTCRFPEDAFINPVEGLWFLQINCTSVLIAGSCDKNMLKIALAAYPWDVVLFRKGIPWLDSEVIRCQPERKIVGDGTLRTFEISRLRNACPDIYFTALEGAWCQTIHHPETSRE